MLVGRPALWGLAAGGEQGARDVLGLLTDEVARGKLALLGCASPADVTRCTRLMLRGREGTT